MTSSSSSSAAPPWADASSSASKRPAPIEDHRGTIAGGAAVAMTDDDGLLLAPVSTLDEPVSETIMRDVRAVGAKLRAVLLPLDRTVSSVCGGGGHSSRSFGGKIISFPKKSEVGFPPSPPPPPSFLKIYIRRVWLHNPFFHTTETVRIRRRPPGGGCKPERRATGRVESAPRLGFVVSSCRYYYEY